MYVKHSVLVTPDDATPIWRYQDLGKLISMIERQALFFSRVDRLGDPYEGARTLGETFARNLAAYSVAKKRGTSDREIVERLREDARRRREHVFVNCWYMGDHESDAMWRLYCRSGECVAISSTVGRLKSALSGAPQRIFLAEIKYIDYGLQFLPSDSELQPFVHKRISFQHERELRAIATTDLIEFNAADFGLDAYVDWLRAADDGGVYVPVDVTTLIKELRLPPYAPPWFQQVVDAVLGKFGIQARVEKSTLSTPPDY
jgi:hypothetical protein